jgi:hypothetical protein
MTRLYCPERLYKLIAGLKIETAKSKTAIFGLQWPTTQVYLSKNELQAPFEFIILLF